MTVKAVLKTVLLISLLPLQLACSQGLPPQMAREQAQNLLQTLKADGPDAALALYSDEFYNARPEEQWQRELHKLFDELGAMESFVLRKEHYDSRYSARFYLFEYQTIHARGKAWQILTVINPVGTDELKIVGHQIKR